MMTIAVCFNNFSIFRPIIYCNKASPKSIMALPLLRCIHGRDAILMNPHWLDLPLKNVNGQSLTRSMPINWKAFKIWFHVSTANTFTNYPTAFPVLLFRSIEDPSLNECFGVEVSDDEIATMKRTRLLSLSKEMWMRCISSRHSFRKCKWKRGAVYMTFVNF